MSEKYITIQLFASHIHKEKKRGTSPLSCEVKKSHKLKRNNLMQKRVNIKIIPLFVPKKE